jgi:AcrR family transcriptional regulator
MVASPRVMQSQTEPGRHLRRDAARNRARIIAAAGELFSEQGLETGVEEIADRASVGVGTLYRHFPTKAGLVDAIFEERLDGLEQTAAACAAIADPAAGLRAFLERILSLLASDRGLRDLVATRQGDRRLANTWKRSAPHLARLIERAQDSGSLRGDVSVTDVPPLLWGASRVIERTAEVAPGYWRRYLEILLAGLDPCSAQLSRPPLKETELARALAGTK